MRLLAIDTTGVVTGVALVEKEPETEYRDAKVLAEFMTNDRKNHSQSLMPIVSALLETVGVETADIDYVACASGPGSFTGLRIGAATAKALAHGMYLSRGSGTREMIIPVPTLDALAYNVYDTSRIIVPVMDARRNQVYAAVYRWKDGVPVRLSDFMNADIRRVMELAAEIAERENTEAVFTGDGAAPFGDIIRAGGFTTSPEYFNRQRAGSVGMLACHPAYLEEEKLADYRKFTPFYLRKPQAEREYDQGRTQEGKNA